MKRLLLLLFFIPFISLAQVPQGINYQAIARDTLGNEILNQNLTIKLTVLSNGTNVWEELHSTSTNNYGLFTLVVGQGASTGAGAVAAFSDIDWGGAATFDKGDKLQIGIQSDTVAGNSSGYWTCVFEFNVD